MTKRLYHLAFCLVAIMFLAVAGLSPNSFLAIANPVQNDKAKDELYTRFRTNSGGDLNAQKTAYEAGKEYLKKYPNDTDARAKEIRDWVALFERETRAVDVLVKVFREKKFPEAFELGKQVLATDPNHIKVLTALGYGGMLSAANGNDDFNVDATAYAKKAIQLIEGGQAPADWKPFVSRDETLGWLNYSLGLLTARTMPGEAITYFTKAAGYEGAPKKDPTLYYYIAALYEMDYQKLTTEYSTKHGGKPDTPAGKAALENVNATIDLVIDAYARTIAAIDADPQFQQRFQSQKTAWMEKLTTYYKFRHNNSDSGLRELIAGVSSKPLPTQPPSTPATTP